MYYCATGDAADGGTMDHRGIIPVEGIVKSTHENQPDA